MAMWPVLSRELPAACLCPAHGPTDSSSGSLHCSCPVHAGPVFPVSLSAHMAQSTQPLSSGGVHCVMAAPPAWPAQGPLSSLFSDLSLTGSRCCRSLVRPWPGCSLAVWHASHGAVVTMSTCVCCSIELNMSYAYQQVSSFFNRDVSRFGWDRLLCNRLHVDCRAHSPDAADGVHCLH